MAVEEHEENEGLSKPKKVVAGAALGVAVPAAVAVAKKLIGGNGEDDNDGRDEPMGRERKQQATSRSASSRSGSGEKRSGRSTSTRSSSTRSSSTRKTATAAKTRTREQLYKQATRLKIEGRSGMNKAELERAVNRAKQKAAR